MQSGVINWEIKVDLRLSCIKSLHATWLIAELRRAKRASGAPWVIKFGKPSIRENLVMT